jgi:hypothetical protein
LTRITCGHQPVAISAIWYVPWKIFSSVPRRQGVEGQSFVPPAQGQDPFHLETLGLLVDGVDVVQEEAELQRHRAVAGRRTEEKGGLFSERAAGQ